MIQQINHLNLEQEIDYVSNQIKFKTSMIMSNLYDCSDA